MSDQNTNKMAAQLLVELAAKVGIDSAPVYVEAMLIGNARDRKVKSLLSAIPTINPQLREDVVKLTDELNNFMKGHLDAMMAEIQRVQPQIEELITRIAAEEADITPKH